MSNFVKLILFKTSKKPINMRRKIVFLSSSFLNLKALKKTFRIKSKNNYDDGR